MFFSKASMNRDFFSNNKVGEKLTLYYNELKEAIDRGYIKGDTVQIIRKNGLAQASFFIAVKTDLSANCGYNRK